MGRADLESKVLEIRDRWLNFVKDPNYRMQAESLGNITNLLELIYVEPGQFVLEFLQNAEDALLEAGRTGYFKVELYGDKVIISNNGKPFDEKDLESLCAIASKKKPALGYKGFIGIGWKSVYKASNHVEVCSAGICFEFNEEFWKKPEAQEILKKYDLKPDEVLWQVTPILIQPTAALPKDETRFTIYLKNPSLSSEIAKVLDELKPPIFLFLDHVSSITIIDHVNNERKSISWSVEKEEMFNDVKVRVVTVHVSEEGGTPTWNKFLVFKKEFEVPEDVKKDPVSINAKRGDVVKREVAIAFELDPVTGDLRPIEETRFWLMYSFLPLTEVRTGLKFLIQADFIVHPGRRYINVSAKWNRWMMQCLAELLKSVIDYVRNEFKKSYLTAFDYRPVGDEVWDNLIEPYIVNTIEEVLKDPTVLCYKGHEVKLTQVVKASEEVYELIKYDKHELFNEEDLKYIYGVEKHILDQGLKLREVDENRVPKLTLVDLLNENLLKALMSRDLDKVIKFLSKVYELARGKGIRIPPEKRFIVTSSGELKLASSVYIPKMPERVIEISSKFPEVDKYLKSLDFVNEEMTKLVGEEALKSLGVKEVSLNEIVGIILNQIGTGNPPPNKERLLITTLLVKQAGMVADKPIWVLTKDGDIEKSYNVWNPELFTGFEDVAKLLGVKLLDIDAYTKYDGDVEGWRGFFGKVVLGYGQLYECYSSSQMEWLTPQFTPQNRTMRCELHKYVQDLINKVKEALEKSASIDNIDNNIKLVRLLHRLWQHSTSAQWGKVRVKLVTDEDSFAYSDQLLLHDIYGAKEQWSKWKAEKFNIGPFVSPKYLLEKSEEAPSWKEFFVNVLGVKEIADIEEVEEFAEWFTKRMLEKKGYRISGKGSGCDFNIIDVSGETTCVEVKGRKVPINTLFIELTENETKTALNMGDKYWLAVVESIPNNPRLWILKNPARVLPEIKEIKINGEKIKEHSELWIEEQKPISSS